MRTGRFAGRFTGPPRDRFIGGYINQDYRRPAMRPPRVCNYRFIAARLLS